MMMDRRHLKETLSPSLFEVCDLYHDREHLDKIDQSDDRDKKRHLHHVRCSCHKAAKRQRSCISHKHLGRIYIKQQKAQQDVYKRQTMMTTMTGTTVTTTMTTTTGTDPCNRD